jgi:lysophospholipase L1-like esterase
MPRPWRRAAIPVVVPTRGAIRRPAIVALCALLVAATVTAAGRERWVATWTTAQLLAQPQVAPSGRFAPPSFSNQTVRMAVRTSIGGRRIRVRLANAFGASPAEIGSAHVARRSAGPAIVAGSDHALSFGGKAGCTIQPGQVVLSDPIDLPVAPLTELAVSLYFPRDTGPATLHYNSLHTTYIGKAGDATGQAAFEAASTTDHYYYLAAIEVAVPDDAALVVALGDSITDGAGSTSEANASWPSRLAERLQRSRRHSRVAVGNAGISGNRLLRDGSGASGLARFDRDVLGQSGVRWLVLLEGINDIGMARSPADTPGRDDLVSAYRQIVERAHAAGIRVVGCTLAPFEGAFYYGEAKETVRSAVNEWIRTSGAFDGVADVDAALRDPVSPRRLRPVFDTGDHLHPNDAGYAAIADAVLRTLRRVGL